MIDIGDKPLCGNHGGPMGFQVMSNLMRTGDYDDKLRAPGRATSMHAQSWTARLLAVQQTSVDIST
ncbi:hypothetical protein [Streptomyces mexicanus]|uniref:Uncharacterized protein n=1 Tax=Streptomyces mexicanus TaxID=178566 RepID=A0A7X1LVW6_9ACTN|nr:hypothetical protein [Streptomyces mexicanus]MBC2869816.1 hypothetical protein [Streptomyces mexicanus]